MNDNSDKRGCQFPWVLTTFLVLLGLTGLIPVEGFLKPQRRSQVSRTLSNFRAIELALKAYISETGSMPSFLVVQSNDDPTTRRQLSLTWPEAGLTTGTLSILKPTQDQSDVFQRPRSSYSYMWREEWVMLLSPGPDYDDDVEIPEDFPLNTPLYNGLVISKTYDPTNGVISDGDICYFINLDALKLEKSRFAEPISRLDQGKTFPSDPALSSDSPPASP